MSSIILYLSDVFCSTNNAMVVKSSESIDDPQSEEDKLGTLCNKYLNEHNTSLAQNFKYMRNKPIIVVFKAPGKDTYI